MSQNFSTDIAVIGAGVVGLTIALRLAQAGREVILVDPDQPGAGASAGNAGTIADHAVQPVGTPAVLRALPRLLLDPSAPLAIRRAGLLAVAPWLVRFLRASMPAAARRNAQAIAALTLGASPRWEALVQEIGAADLLEHRGCLHIYGSATGRAAAEEDMAFRRTLGVNVELLSSDEVAALEPNLPQIDHGGAFCPGSAFVTDPAALMARLTEAALAAGAGLLRGRAIRLERLVDGAQIGGEMAGGRDFRLHARQTVIAAGAHGRRLARQAGDRVPLDTERGYHLEFDMAEPVLTRPVSPPARGYYFSPMRGRLRVAGTVELGGLKAPPSPRRLGLLLAGARRVFPDLTDPDRGWMGFRPSVPDSVPVIGPSRAGPEVWHAYGHGHIGLTLAPVTAEIVVRGLLGAPQDFDIAPYRPGRF